MRILNITLCNFLCYYGENKLEFTDGLNLILGANGYGKSKLYDAFQWVFRDGITDDKPRLGAAANAIRTTAELRHRLANERALAEANVDDKVVCEVCIEVMSSQDKSYRLIRRLNVVKTGAGVNDFKAASSSHLEVYYKDVLNFKPLSKDEGEEKLAQLIPADIMPYLWFQGERGINSLIDTSSKESLKQVVNKMSDIDKWDKFIEAAQTAYAAADKELKQALSGDTNRKQKAATYQAQQQSVQSRLETVETKILEAEKNFDAASSKFDNIIGQLSAATKISSLEKDIAAKELDYRRVSRRIDEAKLGFTKRLFTDAWLLMGTEKLVDKFEEKYSTYSKFVMKREAEQQLASAQSEKVEVPRLPKGIPDRVHVVDMLRREHCLVCDRPAPKDSAEYKAIESLMPKEKPKSVAQLATIPDIEPELRIMNRAAFSLREKYTKAESEIATSYVEQAQLEEELQELEAEIISLKDAISTELLNSGLSVNGSAGNILVSIDTTKRDMNIYSGSLERLRVEREGYVQDLKLIEAEFGKLLSQGGGIDAKLEEKRKLLADLRDLTERSKQTQYEKLIQQLEDTSNRHFANMNKRTGAGYGIIRFVREGNGYVPEIQDNEGHRQDNLNTSQVSSFKLAIIMAIVTANQSRGLAKNYPLITDAPMSDFDAVKARDFLAETAQAFGQSIVIAKEFLEADPRKDGCYLADKSKLKQVKEYVEAAGKTLNVYQLVIPTGQSVQNRKHLSVQITRLAV